MNVLKLLENSYEVVQYDPKLHDDQKKQYLNANNERRAIELATSRVALKNLLVKKNIPHDLKLTISNHHYLSTDPNTLVSFSHTQNFGGAIIGQRSDNIFSVGIDIELNSRKISPNIEKYFLSTTDQPKTEKEILKIWTQKEAIFKTLSPMIKETILFKEIIIAQNKFSYQERYQGVIKTIEDKDLFISIAATI